MNDGLYEFDLVVRSELQIDAEPGAVWQVLDRLGEWKASVVSVERLEGSPGAVGELLRIGQRVGDRIVYVTHRTAHVEPVSWRVQWLETEDGRSTRGYLVYSLQQTGAGTLLVGELLARAAVPAGSVPGGSDEDASRMICEATQAKFHADHRVLKYLVEKERQDPWPPDAGAGR